MQLILAETGKGLCKKTVFGLVGVAVGTPRPHRLTVTLT